MRREIFQKQKLIPAQLRTVADRRFGDAVALRNTGKNERANGEIYLAGYVLECMLKAMLLTKHPRLQFVSDPEKLSKADRRRWTLSRATHDLLAIVEELPDLRRRIQNLPPGEAMRFNASLDAICTSWTVHSRYSTHQETMTEAADFLARVTELRAWLR